MAMIENYRGGLVWRVMRRNPHLVRGLRRAGFAGGWLAGSPLGETDRALKSPLGADTTLRRETGPR